MKLLGATAGLGTGRVGMSKPARGSGALEEPGELHIREAPTTREHRGEVAMRAEGSSRKTQLQRCS